MSEFLWGFAIGAGCLAAIWIFKAKILGYATQEEQALKAKISPKPPAPPVAKP